MEDYRLEVLADDLFVKLKENKNPFNKLIVACPSRKTVQWLKAYWLKTQKNVLMNVDFVTINKALFDMVETGKNISVLNSDALRLLIIKELSENSDRYPFVKGYIIDSQTNRLDSIKLYDLSDKLAKFFLEYEKECFDFCGWERDLYEAIFSRALANNVSTLGYVINVYKQYSYKKYSNPLYVFGVIEFDKLQEKMIDECNNEIVIYRLVKEDNLMSNVSFIEAPSKMREIEAVHSKICSIVMGNKEVKYNDFLVLAPNIKKYATTIQRVFVQEKEGFPNIPFSINDFSRSVTDASSVIDRLISISKKGFFTRFDFFELINNKMIQDIREITADDVACWTRAIIAMNVYRNKKDAVNKSFDDWDYAKKRVLLAKITDINEQDNNIVELSDDEYVPFSSISLNDDSITKFVRIIDDIKSWMLFINRNEYVSKDALSELEVELNKWFKPKIDDLQGNGKRYRKLNKELYLWMRVLKEDTSSTIPMDCLLYALVDCAQTSTFNSGSFFMNGVSFANVSEEVALACKYVFLLDASSANLPRKKVKNEADLRVNNDNWLKLRNSLFIQGQNCEHLTVSYVYKDLKSDEDFYPSQFILDLQAGKTEDDIKKLTTRIDIDETRDWSELFTIREFENKQYLSGLLTETKPKAMEAKPYVSSNVVKKIKVKEMARFLKEPLMYKASKLFGNVDDSDEKMRDEYEPLVLDNLNGTIIRGHITKELLKNKGKALGDSYRKKLKLNRVLPVASDVLANNEYNKKVKEAAEISDLISIVGINYEMIRLNELSLNNGKDTWILIADNDCCIEVDGDNRRYFDYEKKLSDKGTLTDLIDKRLLCYVYSLMDIASLETEQSYNVKIHAGNSGCVYSYTIAPKKARDVLNLIYTEMNDYSNNFFFPIGHVLQQPLLSYEQLLLDLDGEHNVWSYFADRKMFDLNEQLGYENCRYNNNEFCKYFEKLILKKKEETSNGKF